MPPAKSSGDSAVWWRVSGSTVECARARVVVGHTKGGGAKPSLALTLAIRRASQGRDVLLVDADEQQTASKFAALRSSLETGGALYQTAAYVGRAVRGQVQALAPRLQDTVIGVGGRNTDSQRAALMVADRLIVPVPPASFKVWEVETIGELVGAAKVIRTAKPISVRVA